ncbi:hypothetical protein DPMN_160065 [Dreissena polymorpha]|uniref:Uncharacterized protein n=1 Tax=Dreissena polymorpha TaxID=45954 RepID=A0A9D4EK50_DREPO|nr:hypothetical protein DPMN_160065 [Dreissena polymorpha]
MNGAGYPSTMNGAGYPSTMNGAGYPPTMNGKGRAYMNTCVKCFQPLYTCEGIAHFPTSLHFVSV